MKFLAFLLPALLILKDASHLGDRFITRGLAEGLCGLAAVLWIITHLKRVDWRQHALLLAYLAVIFITGIFSDFRAAVMIQFLSLLTVILFGISLRYHPIGADAHRVLMETTFWAYLAVTIISILLLFIAPSIVYQVGNIAGWKRFAGLYDRPAMLGAASGILFGIALFGTVRGGWLAKLARIAAVIAALTCLYMSGARTFWVAFIVAAPMTAVVKYPRKIKMIMSFVTVAIILFSVYEAFDFHISKKSAEKELRVGSVSTLTGRTTIWEATFAAIQARPLTGFGLGMGGVALVHRPGHAASLIKERISVGASLSRVPSLHSGYIQALGDTGVLGALVYLAVVVMTCLHYWRHRRAVQFGAECFIVLYLTTANIAESIIYKASVWHSIMFWYLAAYVPVIMISSIRKPNINGDAYEASITSTDGNPRHIQRRY